MKKDISNLFISKEADILTAMKIMDEQRKKLLIVGENNKYYGLLSIGDIQRAMIRDNKLSNSIESIMRTDYVVATPTVTESEIKELMLQLRAEFMPVVDENKEVISVFFWEDFFGDIVQAPLFKFNIPVVIMAGGFGSRMRPLTYVLPKPLIPINDKTFLEEIFERFYKHGCDRFYLSVNYKADLIKYYLKEQNLPYYIDYFIEDKPLGTAGSLSLLKEKINETFFVSNCDILIEQDYSEVLKYHRDNKNDITVISALKNYHIPYGTIETGENGKLIKLVEKPDMTFQINSGMYILEPHLLTEIPEGDFFHITHLIEQTKDKGGKVGVFPVSEKSWKDIGQWDEYLKNINA